MFRLKIDTKLPAAFSPISSTSEEIGNRQDSSGGLRKFAENVSESSLLGG
jgi:hypothetical protein